MQLLIKSVCKSKSYLVKIKIALTFRVLFGIDDPVPRKIKRGNCSALTAADLRAVCCASCCFNSASASLKSGNSSSSLRYSCGFKDASSVLE